MILIRHSFLPRSQEYRREVSWCGSRNLEILFQSHNNFRSVSTSLAYYFIHVHNNNVDVCSARLSTTRKLFLLLCLLTLSLPVTDSHCLSASLRPLLISLSLILFVAAPVFLFIFVLFHRFILSFCSSLSCQSDLPSMSRHVSLLSNFTSPIL